MQIEHVGGSLTGGSTVVATPVLAGNGKGKYALPGHSRLTVRLLEITTSASAGGNNPVGTTGVKLTFGDRQVEEGCCTVKSGTHQVNLGVNYALEQSEAVLDDMIDTFRAFVFSTAFATAIKSGVVAAN